MVKELFVRFMKKNCKKNQKQFRLHKDITAKPDKEHVKWKGYDIFIKNT